MKTFISITGQPNSIQVLKDAIKAGEVKKLGNHYYIQYQTKKEAKKFLKDAFNYLRHKEYDFEIIGLYNQMECLEYDAGKATIQRGRVI